MSLDDTLERPQSQVRAANPASNWVTIGTCPQMASMNNYPVAMQLGGTTYVISGRDGGNTVLTSPDDGVTWNAPQTGDWPVRRALSGALHAGKFYIVGGFSPGVGFGDTLVSDDCLHFTQVGAAQAPWGVRWAHTLLSTGTNLLMIAGVAGPVYSNEVWSLDDASGAWTKIAQGQFRPRAWAAGAVLGSTLMVIGGWNEPDGAFAETLVSADGGVTWTTYQAPFTPRHSASAVTIGDTVYLVGGCTGRPGTTFYNDTWSTKDGVTWTKVDNTFGPIGRTFAAADLGGQIGVIGSSSNIIGLAPPGWTELAPDPVASGIKAAATGFLNGAYWAWGGALPVSPTQVRTSPDGRSWTLVPQVQPMPVRQDMVGTVHHGQLFATSGDGGSNELFASPDGATWTQVAGSQRFPALSGSNLVSFQDKLWLLGGSIDIWCSEDDGASWALVAPEVFRRWPDTPNAVVFAGQLWMIDGGYREAWSSPNGTDWTMVAENLPFSQRDYFGLNVVGNTLYLVRGRVGGTADAQDVWATTDGETWTQVDTDAPYDTLMIFSTLTVDDVIMLVGGYVGEDDSSHVLQYLPPYLLPA